MVWNAAGNAVYISGMGSNNIIKTYLSSQRMATIAVGNGPTGLAMDTPRNRLYCLNRFDGTVSAINTTNDSEVGRVSFFDPTPPVIKNGRPLLYDAHSGERRGGRAHANKGD
jgi:DNA-binding beta-propeller fold protein YncE